MNISKELNSLNQQIVYSLTKYTTTDYPNHLACIVWVVGCNLRCSYCYNDALVNSKKGSGTLNEVLTFLKTRVGLLDGVVISGGEATMHDLEFFCREVKKMGFKIKLDTNGINSSKIKKLVEENLVDFIALDFKAPKEKYQLLTKTSFYDKWLETLKYLINIDFDFEVRTTINGLLLNENDINSMTKTLFVNKYTGTYYLQQFLQTSSNLGNISKNRVLNDSLIDKSKLSIAYRN